MHIGWQCEYDVLGVAHIRLWVGFMDNAWRQTSCLLNRIEVALVKSLILLMFVLIGTWIQGTVAAVINLKDGSKIRGEIVSMEKGTYTVKTTSIGTIQLSDRQVESITQSESNREAPASIGGDAVKSIQSFIVSNQSLMGSILKLQEDPAMRAVLADPEVMKAVQSMDFKTLSSHPKIKALMNSSEVKSIQQRLH